MMDATSPVLIHDLYATLPSVGRGTVVIHGLAAIRSERLLTQERLEEMAGVDRKTIMRAEAGLPIRFSSAERLAAALKISPKRLLRVPPESN